MKETKKQATEVAKVNGNFNIVKEFLIYEGNKEASY